MIRRAPRLTRFEPIPLLHIRPLEATVPLNDILGAWEAFFYAWHRTWLSEFGDRGLQAGRSSPLLAFTQQCDGRRALITVSTADDYFRR